MSAAVMTDQYFEYESRLQSFQIAHPTSKRRTSTANSKAPKSLKWPHKSPSPEELATAGFFFHPNAANPDNVTCYLCHKSLDGWEAEDDPLAEHLMHSPDCGWAIVADVERKGEDAIHEYPLTLKMIEARKATFGDQWPHESKRGWKCKVKQLAEAGWSYTPTPEYDDTATCAFCLLVLDGWDPNDKPMDEHFKRSPDCTFFRLINEQKPAPKRAKSKRDRASKTSRLSTQSSFTVASEGQSMADLPAEEDDSILTTATTSTQTGRKMGRSKKAVSTKGKIIKANKTESVEVVEAPEPEDADFEVKVDPAPKAARGRKRKSDESTVTETEVENPLPKRRATRTRGSVAVNDSILQDEPNVETAKPKTRKGRASTKSNRKSSTTSAAPVRVTTLTDEEIDRALEADLERPLSEEEEEEVPAPALKKNTRGSKISKADHAMFGVEPREVDEVAIQAELETMEMESKPIPKGKGAKGKQVRKPSAKQQAAARKAAAAAAEEEATQIAELEAEAAAERFDDDEEVSLQLNIELEHSISMQHSSPIIQLKKQRAQPEEPTKQPLRRGTRASRASAQSVDESNVEMVDVFQDATGEQDESGNETDASMASQSTVVRGGSARRGSTLKKAWGGKKKAASRNIEEIVRKDVISVTEDVQPIRKGKKPTVIQRSEEHFATKAPEAAEAPGIFEEESVVSSSNAPHRKTPLRPQIQQTLTAMVENFERVAEAATPLHANAKRAQLKSPTPAPHSPTPPPREATPSQSPQSSDAENHPPSSKPSTKAKIATPQSAAQHISTPRLTTRVPLASTPMLSPSKRNVISGLHSTQPWTAVDLEMIFLKSPTDENVIGSFGDAMQKLTAGALTSSEKKMSVEEWILYNANLAEEKLKEECEGMVGIFEREGGRAMRTLEGIECLD